MSEILITGSEGLIGRVLAELLEHRGRTVRRCDLRAPGRPDRMDVLDPGALRTAVRGVSGVIHLAAVSRVLWGERDPRLCWATNVEGTRGILAQAREAGAWVVLASSREVYGQAARQPVTEDDPLVPMNVYGRSKVAAEQAVIEAREAGLATAVVRLSNVYGRTHDHADRVVPAFARGAAAGAPLRVDGREHVFDFTHVDDTARGLAAVVDLVSSGERRLPPIHLVTGVPTTLGRLAEIAAAATGGRSHLLDAPPRAFDVARFQGDPARARRLLGWRAEIGIDDGMSRLVGEYAALLAGGGVRTTEGV